MAKQRHVINSMEDKKERSSNAKKVLILAKKQEAERLNDGYKYIPTLKGRKLVKMA